MVKRKRQNSDDYAFDAEDNPIGLTGAFPVIRDPQAVKYDEGDQSIGLTEAFGAVSGEEDVVHSWDEAGKWKGFNWDASAAQSEDADSEDADSDTEPADGASEAVDTAEGQHAQPEAAGSAASSGDADASAEEDTPAEGAPAEDTPAADTPAAVDDQVAADTPATSAAPAAKPASGTRGKHGRHAAPEPELTPRMKKSKRTRKVLIVIVVLLILLLGALGFFMFKTFDESQQEAQHQAQEQVAAPKDNITEGASGDAVETVAKLTDVPNITSLLGKTTDEAVAALGHGALITQNREVKDKDSAVKTNINIALTEEPADSKTGTPTVYLGLDKKGTIIQVGYSASASALGFGSLSFADAVAGEHVVEKTLGKIGVEVPEGSAVLPADKAQYSKFASDGTTVVKERCSFEGDTEVNGKPCTWSSVLSYDYATQVVTGNLSDTVRIIYVYVTEK